MMNELDLISTREAAKIIGVSRSMICEYARSGRLPAHRAGSGPTSPYIFMRDDVERLAEARELLRS